MSPPVYSIRWSQACPQSPRPSILSKVSIATVLSGLFRGHVQCASIAPFSSRPAWSSNGVLNGAARIREDS
jgi:hypothetical protein